MVSGYAHKIRRTLFAQLKNEIKSGDVDAREVAFKAGMLNKILYHVFITKLQLDKHDAVRVRVAYDLKDGKIEWDYNSIEIEIWKRNDELASNAVREFENLIKTEKFMQDITYEVEKEGTNKLGEEIHVIKKDGETIGALKTIPLNGEIVVLGAVISPPRKFRKTIPKPEDVYSIVPSILVTAEETTPDEAESIISSLLKEVH